MLIFLIALKVVPFTAAVLCGFLAAISPQFAYFSVVLLPDSLVVPPLLLAVLLLIRGRNFAIAGALDTLARKLERQLRDDKNLREKLEEEIAEDYEEFEEVADEWSDGEDEPDLLTSEDIAVIEQEIIDLRAFRDLAREVIELG